MVLPGAILHLDCLFQKSFGQPRWAVAPIVNFEQSKTTSTSQNEAYSSALNKESNNAQKISKNKITKQQNDKTGKRTGKK